jgi:Ca2+-binding RTX toxin-like protein
MLRRTLPVAAVAALATPAAASAATINTTATEVVYTAGMGEPVSLLVYSGFDDDLHDSAVFFLPTPGNSTDPATGDGACVSRVTGASSCALGTPTRQRTRIQLAEQDDFANVGGATDTVEFHGGGGVDRVFTTGSKLEAYGDGGNDWLQGGPGFDRLDGGAGDDLLDPSNFGDDVRGGTGFDTARVSASGVVVTLDDVANDGVPSAGQNIHSDVEKVVAGDGADELEGNASPNTLSGGGGADTITGNGGADALLGDAGADTIRARDGGADAVDCGPGADTAIVDAADVVTSCETVDVPPVVVPPPAPPAAPPAAPITPAAPKRVAAQIVGRWGLARRFTSVIELTVKAIPADGRVAVRCDGKGCPPLGRKTIKVKGGSAKLTKLFDDRRLRRGAVVEVRIIAPGMTGKVVRYRVRGKRKLPVSTTLCLPAGAKQPGAC